MKKTAAMILATTMVMALCAGCGSSGQSTSGTTAAASQTTEAAAEKTDAETEEAAEKAETAAAGNLKAAFITPQALGDGSVTDLSYSGFTRAAEEYGMETQVVEVQVGEYEETLRSMAQEGYGLLVCLQPELVDAVCTVAPEYPDTLFFSMNGEINDIPNVLGSANKEQEGSYLAGVTAALMSETGKIGAVIGQDMAQNNRYAAGYEDGAKAAREDIEVSILYAGTFEDPAKGKELALTLYNSGYDVVYQVAAKTGLGVFEAAKELGAGHYVVGCDVDQSGLLPGQVVGSQITPYDTWVYAAMKDYAEGNFTGGRTEAFSMNRTDGAGFDFDSTGKVDYKDGVKEAVEDSKAKIMSGEIVPESVREKDK